MTTCHYGLKLLVLLFLFTAVTCTEAGSGLPEAADAAATPAAVFGHPVLLGDPSGCEDLDGIAPVAGVDYEPDIQPIFNDTCTGCHGANGALGLDLRPGQSYDNLVGVASNANFDRLRVDPFYPHESTLFLAINCTNPGGPGFQMGNLPLADRALVRDWINQGAHPEPFTPEVPADVDLVPVFPTGTFGGALGLVNAGDGSDRLFVVRQNGTIEVFDEGGSPSVFMSLPGPISTGGERGLLGLAFHPDFADNGRFYVNYTAGSGHPSGAATGDTVISEFQLGFDGLGNPGSERVLMTIVQDFANHNGGNIKFGPDGYLYIGMGDGGSGGDPCNRGQTLDPDDIQTGGSCVDDPTAALLGKMLRIDVDNTTPAGANNLCAANPDGSAEYAVPTDNPFVGEPACAEVWSWGLRNPWRWSFDRDTGDLWIADVGQNRWEEVNLEPFDHPGGANYGWNECEGPFTFPAQNPPQQCQFEHHFPVLYYPISGPPECSVTGGYRYRGPINSLQGAYIYGDYCSGRIWFAWQVGPDEFEEVEFSVEGFDLRSFGEDEHGHVYVVRSGGIWRFDGDQADPPPEITAIDPDSGSESGGTPVTLSGSGFQDGAVVSIGLDECTNVEVQDEATIHCDTPPGEPGTVNVTVENPDSQTDTLAGGYTYLADPEPPPELLSVDPDSGTTAGGTAVTLTGSGFQAGASVDIGPEPCDNVAVESDTVIHCTTPPGMAGSVAVTVHNPDEQSDTLADGFTYVPEPVVESVWPATGSESGGTEVVITGQHFQADAVVTFGANACTEVVVDPPTSITCTTPPGQPGRVDVTVENPDGQSDTLVDGFLYRSDDDEWFHDRFEAP